MLAQDGRVSKPRFRNKVSFQATYTFCYHLLLPL